MGAADALWGVVPAAGSGLRMGAGRPKQYLPLRGRPMLEHSVEALLRAPQCEGVIVALAAEDSEWASTRLARDPRVLRAVGGAERCQSVLNALRVLQPRVPAESWVLVHDAARPCLAARDLQRLFETLREDPVGGLLAEPINDTVKRADSTDRVAGTVPRSGLWRAQTPQMFRLQPLAAALAQAIESGEWVTDESAAIERQGLKPRLVAGSPGNIKVTRPQDLGLAEFYLEAGS